MRKILPSVRGKVSPEGSNPLRFVGNGVERTQLSGEVGWTNPVLDVTDATHTLSWRCGKDYSIAGGADAGWYDQVIYSRLEAVAVRPVVTATNSSLTASRSPGYACILEDADSHSLTPPIDWTPRSPGVAGDGTTKPLTHLAARVGVAQGFHRVHMRE